MIVILAVIGCVVAFGLFVWGVRASARFSIKALPPEVPADPPDDGRYYLGSEVVVTDEADLRDAGDT